MSQIIDAMEKAKMLRKASESPHDGSSAHNNNYFRIILFHVFGIFMGVMIFYGCFRDSSPIDLKSLSEKLDHIEKKIDLLAQNLSEVQKTKTVQNTVAVQGTATSIKEAGSPAITSPQTADQKKEQYHIVQRGETLYSISKHYGITIDEIRRINRLKQTQAIQTGQKLSVAPDKNQQQ
jgi:LysM repeat protein